MANIKVQQKRRHIQNDLGYNGTKSMKIDLAGRLRNIQLGPSHALAPLFEALVNSIHAIEERGNVKGHIRVNFDRDQSQPKLDSSESLGTYPIKNVHIQDNGVGFTDDNYSSFLTSDSLRKAAKGGKGVGRLLWLKAFERAEIRSVFRVSSGKLQSRRFTFALNEPGLIDETLTDVENVEIATLVSLIGLREPYRSQYPRSSEVLSRRIIEHSLQYFALGICPMIEVLNDEGGGYHNLNTIFQREVEKSASTVALNISGQEFTIQHLRVSPKYEKQHRMYYCADKRVVEPEPLEKRVANLSGRLAAPDGSEFMYAGYVSSPFLDSHVDNERTRFSIDDQNDVLGNPGRKTIDQAVMAEAGKFLGPFLAPIKETKEAFIKKYVYEKAPQYRPLIAKKPALLDSIAPDLSEEKLELELYKVQQTYEMEIRETGRSLVAFLSESKPDLKLLKQKYESFLEDWNAVGVSNLARHVVHRRATLDFLKSARKLKESGKYELEQVIHETICPLRISSDELTTDKMNLWVIDEKLAFHEYLASDIPFSQLKKEIIASASDDRPDLLIFNRPAAFVSEQPPFSSVILIEFKRPARDDYDTEDNPIAQVLGYVRQITSGKAKDRSGIPIRIPSNTPFYAYVISDITESLRVQAENASLMNTPDEMGYFGYVASLKTYIEIISLDKLLNDAEKRNKFFFHQLFHGELA